MLSSPRSASRPTQPLYGVEPKGVDGSPTPETVEEIAEYEVAQIRRFQPEGPYYIAGYCAGGAIAFESARQLVEAGGDVARVILFASPFPTVYRTGRLQIHSELPARRHMAPPREALADGLEYVRSRARGHERVEAARSGSREQAPDRGRDDGRRQALRAGVLRRAGRHVSPERGLAPLAAIGPTSGNG